MKHSLLIMISDTHAWLLARESDASPDDVSTLEVEPKSFRTHSILCEAGMYKILALPPTLYGCHIYIVMKH